MLKRILATLAALAMLVTATGTAAAESMEAGAAGGLTLQDIEALNGGPVPVHTENGKVTFVGGTCTAGSVRSFEDAEAVIRAAVPLLGGDEHTAFEPWRVLNDPAGNIYYVFQQVMEDILVQGGAVKIITDRGGNMLGLTGSVIPVAGEATEEAPVSAEQAETLVLMHARETGSAEPDLVAGQTMKIVLPVERELDVNADTVDSRYVWVVYTTNPSAGVAGTDLPYLAHYITLGGEYLYSLPTILPGDAAGTAGYDASYVFEFMEPADYTGYVDFSDGTEHEISVTLMRDTRTGMYYLGNIEHRIVVADCWEFLYNGGRTVIEYSPDNREWDQTSLLSLYNYCRACDYYSAIGWNGADGEGTPIIVLKDFCDKDHNPVDNAAFAGRFYGWEAFLSSSVNDFAQCLDIAAHEFTHCVTGTVMTYNAYMNDYGAINEAMSDIHGNLCEMLAGATEDTTWQVGEHSLEPVRSMSDPHRYQQPDYVWDVYYRPQAKDPTVSNDYGGVHINSSLLNRVAYLLCADGGLSLEDARSYWFAVDCAMVPGSDYAQLSDLLPWVMKITGLERYLDALAKATDSTLLGESGLPDSVGKDKALLTLELPDNEVFNNGNWLLQFASINTDKLMEFVGTLAEDLGSGNLENYPKLIRDLAAPTPTPAPAAEEKAGLLEALLSALTEVQDRADEPEPEPEPEKDDPDRTELLEWARNALGGILYYNSSSAGPDGHSIQVMSRPGKTFPLLTYLAVNADGTVIEQMKFVLFLNGRWFDVSGLLSGPFESTGEDAAEELMNNLLASEIFDELLAALTGSEGTAGFLNALALDVKGGDTVRIPSEGLEKIDLSTGIMNYIISSPEEANNRMSRPKLP